MKCPDAISTEELTLLSEQAPPGIARIDPQDLKREAKRLIQKLEKISQELALYERNSLDLERWSFFNQARRCIKAAIRNFKKSIAI